MYASISRNTKEIKYVLNNLCDDTVLELVKLFGNGYKFKTFCLIRALNKKYIIKLKHTNEPVGLFGLIPQSNNTAGIFLLTTDNLHKGNLITFLRSAKRQIEDWQSEYKLIMDSCYKKNETIKKWLRLLGFKASVYQDDDFQVYYKGDIGLYNND